MRIKLPQIIGHRGCAGYAPENTLEGLHTAADMGVEWVEVDVKLTKDQIPVLFHDETLERTTNGSGAVKDFTLKELKELDAGSWYSDGFYGVTIPTLEEAVEVLLERDLGLNLEIKPCAGREVETAEAALDILSPIWDDHERLLVSSFAYECLEVAHDMVEAWHRGLLLPDDWPEQWKEIAQTLDVSSVNLNGNSASDDQIREAVAFGKPVLAFTINDPERARQLQGLGVRGFFTDEPDVLQDGILSVH